jgi:hypothetical protein
MVWPVSGTLLISWMVENIVEFALYGSIVGLLYKPTSPALRKA